MQSPPDQLEIIRSQPMIDMHEYPKSKKIRQINRNSREINKRLDYQYNSESDMPEFGGEARGKLLEHASVHLQGSTQPRERERERELLIFFFPSNVELICGFSRLFYLNRPGIWTVLQI